MVFALILLTNFLLTSAVVGAPSSRTAAPFLALPNGVSHDPRLSLVEAPIGAPPTVEYTANWAGALLTEGHGTFNTVVGTFIAPLPLGNNGSAAIWVGLDGASCGNAILQTGIDFTISNGQPTYGAWYEWYPAPWIDYTEITVNAGDLITIGVYANSSMSGLAWIQNHNTNVTASQALSSSNALCGQDAEWIVEDYSTNGVLVPFVDFGTVNFMNAIAYGPSGQYSPIGATVMDLVKDGQVVTSTTINGSGVAIQYV